MLPETIRSSTPLGRRSPARLSGSASLRESGASPRHRAPRTTRSCVCWSFSTHPAHVGQELEVCNRRHPCFGCKISVRCVERRATGHFPNVLEPTCPVCIAGRRLIRCFAAVWPLVGRESNWRRPSSRTGFWEALPTPFQFGYVWHRGPALDSIRNCLERAESAHLRPLP